MERWMSFERRGTEVYDAKTGKPISASSIPEEGREIYILGFLGNHVMGKVRLRLDTEHPYFENDCIVASLHKADDDRNCWVTFGYGNKLAVQVSATANGNTTPRSQ